MQIRLHVNYPFSSSDLNFSRQTFEKYSDIKFHINCLVSPEWFRADIRTDMTELIVAFRNFANAPTNAMPSLELSLRRLWHERQIFLTGSLHSLSVNSSIRTATSKP